MNFKEEDCNLVSMGFKAQTNHLINALSLECMRVSTVLDTPRNAEIFYALDELDKAYKDAESKTERIPILARVFELCLIMDVV